MSQEQPLTFDVRRLVRIAWTQRWPLLRFHALVAVLAVAAVLVLPRWYKSSVTLVPAPSEGLTLDLLGATAGFGAGSILSGAPTAQDHLKMVVTSRAVLDSVVSEHDLVERWKLKRADQARERLAEQTTVTTPREGQIIVSVESRSAELAQRLAASFVTHSASEGVRLKTSLASQRRSYLEQRLDDLEREIAKASLDIRAFEEEHGAVALPEQTRETMDAAGTLQA